MHVGTRTRAHTLTHSGKDKAASMAACYKVTLSSGSQTFAGTCTQAFEKHTQHLGRLNAFDLFSNSSNSFVRRQRLVYCNAYCAGRALLFTSHWAEAHFIQKTWYYTCTAPSKDFYLSYALFNFSASQWCLQSLWHYVINGYILSHFAAEKCMQLCDRCVWITGSMEEYTYPRWLPCHRWMQGNK